MNQFVKRRTAAFVFLATSLMAAPAFADSGSSSGWGSWIQVVADYIHQWPG